MSQGESFNLLDREGRPIRMTFRRDGLFLLLTKVEREHELQSVRSMLRGDLDLVPDPRASEGEAGGGALPAPAV